MSPDAAARRPYLSRPYRDKSQRQDETLPSPRKNTPNPRRLDRVSPCPGNSRLRFAKITAADCVFDEAARRHVPQVVNLVRRIRAYIKSGPLRRLCKWKTATGRRPITDRIRLVDRRADNRAGVGADQS